MKESTARTKQILRKEILQIRNLLEPDVISRTSAETSPRILDFIRSTARPRNSRPLTVMSYMSCRGEFPTTDLNLSILEQGWSLVLPYTNRNFDIEACLVDSLDHLSLSPMGIREPDPSSCAHISASEADIILLPGIAFDRRGMRLGYGKGCYDRFLSSASGHPPVTAGLAWSFQLHEEVPSEEHDMYCDYVFTEKQLIRTMR